MRKLGPSSLARLRARGACLLVVAMFGGCAGLASHPPLPTRPAPAAPASLGPETPPAALRAALSEQALLLLGQPYRYGGAAPGGFDCSGLVAYAAARIGLRVPRTAHEQYASSVPVAGPAQPGDLIFMHLARKELHVGIALDPVRFIHAPSSGGRVRIDSLSAHPYAEGFIGARRLGPQS